MSDIAPYIVIGLTSGSLYALTATGLVLTYVTSGIFNFSHGAIGALGAYMFYELNAKQGLPWELSLAIVLLVIAPACGLLLELLSRALVTVSTAYRVVATIGLQLAIVGLLQAHYGVTPLQFPAFLPSNGFEVASVRVGFDQLTVVLISLAVAGGMYLFFRRSSVGVQMRAVVDDADLVGMTGTSPATIRRTAWVIGAVFATLSGILIAPTAGLDATLLSLLVLQALGSAAVGGFRSLPLTYVGGLLVGLLQAFAQDFSGQHSGILALGGLPPSVPFIVLFVVLLAAKRSWLVDFGRAVRIEPARSFLPPQLRLAGSGVALAAAILVPFVVGAKLPVWSAGMAFVVLFASLQLLVRTSGQISLCQAAFAAVGASTFGHLIANGVPWGIAIVLAGLVAVPVGAIVAIPAIRLSGLYLALATFGFGVLVEKLVYSSFLMFGAQTTVATPRPAGFAGDKRFYFVLLFFVVLACGTIGLVNRSRLGRLLRGMADSPVALTTHGLSVNVTRVIVFCLSAFMAGIAGVLISCVGRFGNTQTFNSTYSLIWLAVLAISGRGRQSAAIIAALLFNVAQGYVTNPDLSKYFTPGFGILAVVAVLYTAATSGVVRAGDLEQSDAANVWRARINLRTGPGPARSRSLAEA